VFFLSVRPIVTTLARVVRNRAERSAWLQRLHRRCAAWPMLANGCGSAPTPALPPRVADASAPPCRHWCPEPQRSGCRSRHRRHRTQRDSCPLYQRVEAFPLLSAERYDVSLYGRLFRDHDASPGYRRYRFRDRPQNQRRMALADDASCSVADFDCPTPIEIFDCSTQIEDLRPFGSDQRLR
jgi:hypothetical protein